MTGFFRRLFGAPANQNEMPAGEPDEVFMEVEIYARPVKEGGQWRIAGMLKKSVDGEAVERRFMRADLLPDEGSAKTATIGKARLIIEQNGDGLWRGEDRMV